MFLGYLKGFRWCEHHLPDRWAICRDRCTVQVLTRSRSLAVHLCEEEEEKEEEE